MVFESIEKLKADWTDKYVITDDARPELKRFSGLTGTVKTVNMSGRCLVEFDGRSNIGWYDIDPHFLRVITEPLKKPEAKEAKAAPKAEAKKPAEAAKPAAAAAKDGGSVADILAAARGGAKPAAAKPASSTADILAAARGKAAPAAPKAEVVKAEAPKAAAAPAKADAKSMSVADILAAARGKAPAGAPVAAPTKAEAPAKKESPAPVVEKEEPKVAPAPPAPAASSSGSKKGAFGSVDEIVAYCRQVDAKG